MLLFSIYNELTDVVLISNMGFSDWADVNVMVIMASRRGYAFAQLLAI
jgi:hypothetical protein